MSAGEATPIILASKSQARCLMLENAGLKFKAINPSLDEAAFLRDLDVANAPEAAALALAKEKARIVSAENPDALVIGGDQVLAAADCIISKARDKTEAKEKLKSLRGKTHELLSAVAVAKDGTVIWSHVSQAKLAMHDFHDEFLERYCAAAGDGLTRAVGAYEIEKAGVWLFSSVEGDLFTVMGLPLLPLLSYLREQHKVMP